jgi:hypothetical protein
MHGREQARQARLAEIDAVRQTLPQGAFTLPIAVLNLPESVNEALQSLGSVGEIMLRFLIDENRLRAMLRDCPPDSLEAVRTALDTVIIPEETPETAAAAAALTEAPPTVDDELRPRKDLRTAIARDYETPTDDDDDDELGSAKGGKNKKDKKNKGRQLIYDEQVGSVVVKRQRKRGGQWDGDWES